MPVSMRERSRDARTRGSAFGRFLWVALVATACQPVGRAAEPPAPEDAGPSPVVVEQGTLTEQEQAAADSLWAAAEESAEARRYFEVLRTTEEILSDYPASSVSGEALRLSAIAQLEVGAPERADEVAERYISLLDADDPRRSEMRLLQARAAENEPTRRLDRLLGIDAGAPEEVIAEATPLTRETADALLAEEVSAALDAAPADAPMRPVAEARLSVALLELGRDDEGALYADRAIAGGVTGEDLEWAQGVLDGALPEGRGRVTTFSIAMVLPNGGPPALAEYSAQIAEGVEVAMATVLGDEYDVTLVQRDDEGDPAVSARMVAELEAQGVVGVVGLLQDEALESAGSARQTGLPLVSPTARSASNPGDAIYSLEGADVESARTVARYGASRAYQRIAMLYPDTPVAQAEAEAFQVAAEALGMSVVGSFTYEAGATFFEPQIIAALDALRAQELAALASPPEDSLAVDTLQVEMLEPAALFMPIPPEDVEFLAPQVIHFGLDTLAIEVLGTSGWTDPQTLAVMEPRLTDGVVATAAVASDGATAGRERFRDAYETQFQRSLVGTAPAVGYDATLLLLEALRPGRVQPEQLRASFEALSDIEGATGVYSIVDGRIVRRTELVRIQGRAPIPLEVR